MGMIKFAVKVGLLAGAGYYLQEQGVWKDSHETTKLYGKMYGNIEPYLQEAKKQLPVQIPPLPSTDRTSFLLKNYWNKGVIAMFAFVGDLPKNANRWIWNGVGALKQNPNLQQFAESITSLINKN